MINAGIGARQVATLFTTLNIKPPLQSALKERQREMGKVLKSVAKDSADQALLVSNMHL